MWPQDYKVKPPSPQYAIHCVVGLWYYNAKTLYLDTTNIKPEDHFFTVTPLYVPKYYQNWNLVGNSQGLT